MYEQRRREANKEFDRYQKQLKAAKKSGSKAAADKARRCAGRGGFWGGAGAPGGTRRRRPPGQRGRAVGVLCHPSMRHAQPHPARQPLHQPQVEKGAKAKQKQKAKAQGGADAAAAASDAPRQWNDYTVHFAFPEPTELAPPLLQLIDAKCGGAGCWVAAREGSGAAEAALSLWPHLPCLEQHTLFVPPWN